MGFEGFMGSLVGYAASTALVVVIVAFLAKLTKGFFKTEGKTLLFNILYQCVFAVAMSVLMILIMYFSASQFYTSSYEGYAILSIGCTIAAVSGIVFGPISGFTTGFVGLMLAVLDGIGYGAGNEVGLKVFYGLAILFVGVGSGFYGYYLLKDDNAFAKKIKLSKDGNFTQVGAVAFGGAVATLELIFILLGGLCSGFGVDALAIFGLAILPVALANVGGMWLANEVMKLFGDTNYHFAAGEQICMDKWFAKLGKKEDKTEDVEEKEEVTEEKVEEPVEEKTEEPVVEEQPAEPVVVDDYVQPIDDSEQPQE